MLQSTIHIELKYRDVHCNPSRLPDRQIAFGPNAVASVLMSGVKHKILTNLETQAAYAGRNKEPVDRLS